jgi:hypothetical protein
VPNQAVELPVTAKNRGAFYRYYYEPTFGVAE